MTKRCVAKCALLAACLGALLLVTAGQASAQLFQRDPLTRSEANALRQAAGNPAKRINLLLRDAARRLGRFEHIQHGHGEGRRDKMYRLLQNYRTIISELDDNIDQMVSGRRTEFMGKVKPAKPLKQVIRTETGFLAQLQHIRASSLPSDLASYHYELQNCLDRTRESLSNAKDDLTAARAKAKKTKKSRN